MPAATGLPFAPYASLAEAKGWLAVDDTDRDAEIQGMIDAATAQVIQYLGFDISKGEEAETLFGRGTFMLFPTRNYVSAVASIVDGVTGAAVSSFRFDPKAIIRSDGARFASDYPYVVTYTAGLDPIPEDVKTAVKITVAALFNAPAFDPNLAGESLQGVFSGSTHQGGAGSLPPAAQSLLRQKRRVY